MYAYIKSILKTLGIAKRYRGIYPETEQVSRQCPETSVIDNTIISIPPFRL